MFDALDTDVTTENLLVNYIEGETEHLSWLKQQVDLMRTIGLPNYLTAQL
ncbi:hypothetical protein [Hymenobacter profundi]|uniref:Bacterioferritin n=1 Tax=Hymenobacter profundi TaxID=1982110 RepID=A0ABS6X374_9BACT|nr:hypothetical protein [Hymenobacter profundi]MBW3129419.1 hypothetical protein [Hymenobacter profundi]